MRNSLTLLVAACGLFTACGSPPTPEGPQTVANPEWGAWQNAETVPFRFVLEQTFGAEESPEEAVLGGVASVAADDRGRVYVLDDRAGRIVAFSPDGTVRWSFGGPGQGPGEFLFTQGMVWDGAERLLVANQRGARIDAISLEGRLLATYPTGEFGLMFADAVGVLALDRIVMVAPLPQRLGAAVRIVQLTDPPSLSSSFDVDQTGGRTVSTTLGLWPAVSVTPSAIVVTDVTAYRLEEYADDGSLLRTVTRATSRFVPPALTAGERPSITPLSAMHAPLPVGGGHRLVQVDWPTNVSDPASYAALQAQGGRVERESTFDLYDVDGRLLYAWIPTPAERATLPQAILHADGQGRVYGITQAAYPQVGRYQMVVEPE